jgi:hypothetical protein
VALFRKIAFCYRSKPIRGPVLRKAWIQLCRLWIRLTPLVRLVRACGILAAAWALLLYFTGTCYGYRTFFAHFLHIFFIQSALWNRNRRNRNFLP